MTAKLLAKTNWFKCRTEVDLPSNSNHQGGKKSDQDCDIDDAGIMTPDK